MRLRYGSHTTAIDEENMHHFVSEISQLNITAISAFKRRAEAIYDENLSAYVKMVIRRPFAKIIVGSLLRKSPHRVS